MRALSLTLLTLFLLSSLQGYAQTVSGKEIFTGNCQACHSIGGGDLVGPDLAGIMERREESWVKDFITHSQNMVAAGDKEAVEVFNKYNKIAMPPHDFSEEEMNELLGYIDEAGKAAVAESTQEEETAVEEAEPQVVTAQSSQMNWFLNALLGILAVAVILLLVLSGYLYRMLKRLPQ